MSDVNGGAIGPDDPRYQAVVDRQFNKRFSARPEYVRLVDSTEQVVAAVQDAVNDDRRLVVTSGGHCLEGFVSDPEARVIIDVSPMKRIYYDEKRRAIAVEAGATVGETFRARRIILDSSGSRHAGIRAIFSTMHCRSRLHYRRRFQ